MRCFVQAHAMMARWRITPGTFARSRSGATKHMAPFPNAGTWKGVVFSCVRLLRDRLLARLGRPLLSNPTRVELL